MTGERTIPMLPCRDLEVVLAFYGALGFATTYRQQRPNPYAVVEREDLVLHFFGVDGFDPEGSLGNVGVLVPDVDRLHQEFADGLRAAYGAVPVKGIPRLLRPRRKQGTVRGFSVVDPGGNWLRVSRIGDREETRSTSTGLARVLEVAARQGDSHGDERAALAILDRGLAKHPDAPEEERAEAIAYRAELLIRLGLDEAGGAPAGEAATGGAATGEAATGGAATGEAATGGAGRAAQDSG